MTEEGAAPPTSREQRTKKQTPPSQPSRSWFRLPDPVRRIFDKFPLVTYDANNLPQRSTWNRTINVLYIFQKPHSVADQLSCNPSCLKYQASRSAAATTRQALTAQAYLKFRDIRFRSRVANNHASPAGALPFILPATESSGRPSSPVAANKITRWVASQGAREDQIHMREEAYMSLIEHTIRNAWLYHLYLDQDNFRSVAWPLYVEPTSSHGMVRRAIAHQLWSAAQDELLKTYTLIDASDLYHRGEDAFSALGTLLGDDQYFFGAEKPGLFDASLFAYTHLLLDDQMGWTTTTLADALAKHDNLVQHRKRLLKQYFGP